MNREQDDIVSGGSGGYDQREGHGVMKEPTDMPNDGELGQNTDSDPGQAGQSLPAKVLIVEGQTDKERLVTLIDEEVEIICTKGTLSYSRQEFFAEAFPDRDIYVLVDADEPGMKLRNQLKQILPTARHLYTRRMYREVATTPVDVLVDILLAAHFELKAEWLDPF